MTAIPVAGKLGSGLFNIIKDLVNNRKKRIDESIFSNQSDDNLMQETNRNTLVISISTDFHGEIKIYQSTPVTKVDSTLVLMSYKILNELGQLSGGGL